MKIIVCENADKKATFSIKYFELNHCELQSYKNTYD